MRTSTPLLMHTHALKSRDPYLVPGMLSWEE